MLSLHRQAEQDPAEWAGDPRALVERIGSADGLRQLARVSGAAPLSTVHDVPSLRAFLEAYHRERLRPVELPTICHAWRHAQRYEVRELIALDRRLAGAPGAKPLAEASRRAGWNQLRRLRPLRDQRLVQRYLRAVEAGEAYAWHTVVYGVLLALYGLPLRQGLLSFAWQTTRGFVEAAARGLELSAGDREALVEAACRQLPETVNGVVDAGYFGSTSQPSSRSRCSL
jgi:urease accessory protein UreF